jgi:excisionase family DNA binding protein
MISTATVPNTSGDYRPPDERLAVSIAEAAEMIGVSLNHIRKLLADPANALYGIRSGRRLLVPMDALREYARTGDTQ